MSQDHQWYFIGLFDVLGFEEKFSQIGLSGMAALYNALISDVDAMNAHAAELKELLNLDDEAIWTADGDAFVFNRVDGAYASDSIVLWAHAHFPEARALSHEQRESLASDPADGWMYHIVPCDRFLEACNKLLCHSLEIGLPLRGAVSMGPAIIDQQRRVFLGKPLIDAARAEKAQRIIGAAFTPSFVDQVIPERFSLSFKEHIKPGSEALLSEYLLDWPRHWRRTRSKELGSTVIELNKDPKFSAYYENTLSFIAACEGRNPQQDNPSHWSIRGTYPQFSSPEIKLRVRAVRGPFQPTSQANKGTEEPPPRK